MKRLSQAQAADILFDFYAERVDEPVSDMTVASETGLTLHQIQYGKILLREVIAASSDFMYATKAGCKGGTYLTYSTDKARGYITARAAIARVQASRVIKSTLTSLAAVDPTAKFILRQYERIEEDLQLLAEIAAA